MHDILLSKIAANATDTTWAQAYSTINFYLAISVSSPKPEKSIASLGKEVLERIQREFFALDEKNLDTIKQAVTNGVEAHKDSLEISLILATIADGTLYLISYGPSQVTLKRGTELGVIAQGEQHQLHGFSGMVQPYDVVILETAGFADQLPTQELSRHLSSANVVEISEELTPLIHENAQGNEAAIILQYMGSPISSHIPSEEPEDAEDISEEENSPDDTTTHAALPKLPSLPKLSIPKFPVDRKKLLISGVIILIAILVVSIIHDSINKQTSQEDKILQSILSPAQNDYNNAIALTTIQKPLAIQKLKDAQAILVSGQTKLTPGSSQEQQLNQFLTKVNNELQQLQQGTQVNNTKIIFDATSNSLKTASLVVFLNNQLVVANSAGAAAVLSTDGTVQKTYNGKESPTVALTATSSYIFEAGDKRIYRIDLSSGSGSDITTQSPLSSSVGGLATFGNNVYLLNSTSHDVEKFAAGSYNKSSYFTSNVSFNSPPVSFAIDGSVWVIQQNGTIRKFTRGQESPFTITGLPSPLGRHLIITTDVGYTNLYVLDSDNSRIVVIGKDGTYKNQYKSPDFQNATSIAVDEASKIAYVISNNKVISLPL